MKKIILASGSPRRKELLSQVGIKFDVRISNAEEIIMETEPGRIVMELSGIKAAAVAYEINSDKTGIDDIVVIGADTIVYQDGKVLGKPADKVEAYQMIESLAGETHQVYTGVTLLCGLDKIQFYEKTDVCVYPMSECEINDYLATGESMDKAGAYGIQGAFAAYVKKIDGDYNNVVGLPVARLYHELRKADLL